MPAASSALSGTAVHSLYCVTGVTLPIFFRKDFSFGYACDLYQNFLSDFLIGNRCDIYQKSFFKKFFNWLSVLLKYNVEYI